MLLKTWHLYWHILNYWWFWNTRNEVFIHLSVPIDTSLSHLTLQLDVFCIIHDYSANNLIKRIANWMWHIPMGWEENPYPSKSIWHSSVCVLIEPDCLIYLRSSHIICLVFACNHKPFSRRYIDRACREKIECLYTIQKLLKMCLFFTGFYVKLAALGHLFSA